jgi:hypothetical protein
MGNREKHAIDEGFGMGDNLHNNCAVFRKVEPIINL